MLVGNKAVITVNDPCYEHAFKVGTVVEYAGLDMYGRQVFIGPTDSGVIPVETYLMCGEFEWLKE